MHASCSRPSRLHAHPMSQPPASPRPPPFSLHLAQALQQQLLALLQDSLQLQQL